MSVVVSIHVPVSDVAKAVQGLHDKVAFLEEINESVKGAGLIRHQFLAGDGELVVLDEWETAAQFQSFFEGNPRVGAVMSSVGMSGVPVVSVYETIDAAGTV